MFHVLYMCHSLMSSLFSRPYLLPPLPVFALTLLPFQSCISLSSPLPDFPLSQPFFPLTPVPFPQFTLRVRVSDGANAPAVTDVVVMVVNVNDLKPVFQRGNYSFVVTENTDCSVPLGQVREREREKKKKREKKREKKERKKRERLPREVFIVTEKQVEALTYYVTNIVGKVVFSHAHVSGKVTFQGPFSVAM